MADSAPNQDIGVASAGATMNPQYTQRRGNTYAVSETDLMIVATLTTESSRLYSCGAFLLGLLASIWISYGLSSSVLSPVAFFCLHTGSWILGSSSTILFLWGYAITSQKNKIIDQIRRECGIQPDPRMLSLCYEFVRQPMIVFLLKRKRSLQVTTHAD